MMQQKQQQRQQQQQQRQQQQQQRQRQKQQRHIISYRDNAVAEDFSCGARKKCGEQDEGTVEDEED
jgi:hypothetical protein